MVLVVHREACGPSFRGEMQAFGVQDHILPDFPREKLRVNVCSLSREPCWDRQLTEEFGVVF